MYNFALVFLVLSGILLVLGIVLILTDFTQDKLLFFVAAVGSMKMFLYLSDKYRKKDQEP